MVTVQGTSSPKRIDAFLAAPPIKMTLATIGAGVLVTVGVYGAALGLLLTVPSLQQSSAVVIVVAILLHACSMLALTVFFLRKSNTPLAGIGFGRPSWRLLHLLWQVPTIIVALLMAQGLVFVVTGGVPGGETDSTASLAMEVTPLLAALLFLAVAVLTPL